MTSKQYRALVVEDEALIRFGIADLCERAGYVVEEAADAHSALDLFRKDTSFDLLITDVDMPGDLNGVDLAWQVFRANPSVAVIVVSGKDKVAEDDLPEGARFFSKPCRDSDLLAAIPPQKAKTE